MHTLHVYRAVIDGAAMSLCGRLKENNNDLPEGMYEAPSLSMVIILLCYRPLPEASGVVSRFLYQPYSL